MPLSIHTTTSVRKQLLQIKKNNINNNSTGWPSLYCLDLIFAEMAVIMLTSYCEKTLIAELIQILFLSFGFGKTFVGPFSKINSSSVMGCIT